MTFIYKAFVSPHWIDYNGHMQDTYYGFVFSSSVDVLQDEVGFDDEYRQSTGCYLSCGRVQGLSARS